MKYGNISEIAQYNRENGTNFYTMEQVEWHKRKNSAEEFEKKHPFLASLSKSAKEARDARIGAVGAEQVRDLYNKGENKLASELNNKYLGANASGILSAPLAGEFITYGPLVGTLRLGAGTAGSAAGSYIAGKAGYFADKKLGTNWIGNTGRVLGGFAGFGAGMKSTTPLLQRAAARNISLGIPKETFVNLRKEGLSSEIARALNREVKGTEIVDSPVTQNILAGKLGWAPRQSRVIWHNSKSPISKLESTFPAWDTVERGAPLGHVWGTGSETNLGFIGKRPFHLRSTKPVEMNKPMVQLNESVGNGKNAVRNEILKYADQSGADAVNFSNIKDNTLSNQDVYAVFKNVEVKPKLSEAERLGIPKGERSNPKALEDPQYWGYRQWNDRYNAAVESGNVDEARRIKKLHTDINAKRFDGSSIFTGYHFTTNPELLSFNWVNKGYIKRQNPIYLTSSEIGKSIYNPGDAFPSQIRKKFYIKMRNPLSEIKSERDYWGDLDKTLSTNPTAREEIRKFWRNKYDSLDDAAIEAHEAGNKDLSKELSKEMFRIWDNNIHGTYSKQFKMKQSEIFDLSRDPNFENLLKQEFNSDGIIHNVSGTKHYITYNPKSIKSANVITYDDFGNMIPIVKRDNFRNPDLRYKQGGILKGQGGLGKIPILGKFLKDKAYTVITDPNVWWKAGADNTDIKNALFRKTPDSSADNNKYMFIYGADKLRDRTSDGEAYTWAKDIQENNYKNVESFEGLTF